MSATGYVYIMMTQPDMMCQVDPDQNAANGIALRTKDDMLRLDSMVMSVQLSIRKLLVRALPSVAF